MDWNKKVYPKDLWNKFKSILPKRTGSKRRNPMSRFWGEYCKANRDIWKLIMSFRPKRRKRELGQYTYTSRPPLRRTPSEIVSGSGRPLFPPPSPRPRQTHRSILERIEEDKLSKEIEAEIESIWEHIAKDRNKRSIYNSINHRKARIKANIDDIWGKIENDHGIFDTHKDYPITQIRPKRRIVK